MSLFFAEADSLIYVALCLRTRCVGSGSRAAMLPEGPADLGSNQTPRTLGSATFCVAPLSADCHSNRKNLLALLFTTKYGYSPRNTCVRSYYFHSVYVANMQPSLAHFTLPALPTQDNQPHESPPFTPAALPV